MSTTDDLSALLGKWRALESAATRGPWEAVASYVDRVDAAASVAMCVRGNGIADDPDAAFIAASRTLVPSLITAVEAVLEVHRPVEVEPSATLCDECSFQLPNGRYFGKVVEWPCPTVAAIEAALWDKS